MTLEKHGYQLHLQQLSGVIYYRPELDVHQGNVSAKAEQGNTNEVRKAGKNRTQSERQSLQ